VTNSLPVVERAVRIGTPLGLHARAAAKFVRLASQFAARITVSRGSGQAMDGKSILGLLLLAAGQGTRLTIAAEGVDAQEAADRLCALVERGFEEAPCES
jgi:phosphocarrier protein